MKTQETIENRAAEIVLEQIQIEKIKNEMFLKNPMGQRCTEEYNSGERVAKSQGYMPLATQIEKMIEAGLRAEQLAQGEYDFQDDLPQQDYFRLGTDPTRNPSYDLADASEHIRRTEDILSSLPTQKTDSKEKNDNDLTKPLSSGDNIIKSEIIANQESTTSDPKSQGGNK